MTRNIVKVINDYRECRQNDTNYNGEIMQHAHKIYVLYSDNTWECQEHTYYTLLGKSEVE